jgi:hypothetical protein
LDIFIVGATVVAGSMLLRLLLGRLATFKLGKSAAKGLALSFDHLETSFHGRLSAQLVREPALESAGVQQGVVKGFKGRKERGSVAGILLHRLGAGRTSESGTGGANRLDIISKSAA